MKAEEFRRKSLALNGELGRKEGMAIQYGNLGILYQALALYPTVGIPEHVTLVEGWMRDAGCSP